MTTASARNGGSARAEAMSRWSISREPGEEVICTAVELTPDRVEE
jgi:hypothetical protein